MDRISLSSYLMWWLWKTKNNWIFKKVKVYKQRLVEEVKLEWIEFEVLQENGFEVQKERVDAEDERFRVSERVAKGLTFTGDFEVARWSVARGVVQHSVEERISYKSEIGELESSWGGKRCR
ncbi:prolinerich spliceosome-associated family protein / zinc knuckle family protein [Striga asiatica]|uniref:Prolinerich spliceosome-associated family protein / zinc knuckle family protein n=1 Tax=Striga asiatica TaxID=4170 RepID=A0A5A7QAH0_STRAF|nr:prolinerich spliceosome-associated family protein / zinc knuckle family protein [Striga asiatica]